MKTGRKNTSRQIVLWSSEELIAYVEWAREWAIDFKD